MGHTQAALSMLSYDSVQKSRESTEVEITEVKKELPETAIVHGVPLHYTNRPTLFFQIGFTMTVPRPTWGAK